MRWRSFTFSWVFGYQHTASKVRKFHSSIRPETSDAQKHNLEIDRLICEYINFPDARKIKERKHKVGKGCILNILKN